MVVRRNVKGKFMNLCQISTVGFDITMCGFVGFLFDGPDFVRLYKFRNTTVEI